MESLPENPDYRYIIVFIPLIHFLVTYRKGGGDYNKAHYLCHDTTYNNTEKG
jgi:hypothetical protein